MPLRILAALAVIAGLGFYAYQSITAPIRARDAVIRDATLRILKTPASAEIVSLRVLETTFRVEVDAQNSYGAMMRSTMLGEYKQVCDDRSSRRCWRAEVTSGF